LGIALVGGCAAPEPAYVLGDLTMKLKPDQRDAVSRTLDQHFGTATAPHFPDSAKQALKLSDARLGQAKDDYRRLCLHCHGVTGDGHGPTAAFLFPPPRDYRPGIYKFTSTGPGVKPTRDDLARTLKQGIPATAMPSFVTQSEETIQGLVDYVILLSIRGEVERFLVDEVEAGATEDEFASNIDEVVKRWVQADSAIVKAEAAKPEYSESSVARGRALFLGKGACAACHGNEGRGDGPSAEVDPKTGKRMEDSWGNASRPADLTLGMYRGGRRPIDLYRRIHSGVKGTPMPGQATAGNLSPVELWDVVHFIQSMPYQKPAATSQPPASHSAARN
jgi:mono/diheme cytochrome c family protein